jgi:hypothetical protein
MAWSLKLEEEALAISGEELGAEAADKVHEAGEVRKAEEEEGPASF